MPKAKTSTAEEIKEEAAEQKEEKKELGNLMYVGPTIPGIGIQNRVYTEIPEDAAAACKEVPEIRNLFIPIIKYPAAEQMLRTGKGYIFSAYKKALEYKENKEKGGK